MIKKSIMTFLVLLTLTTSAFAQDSCDDFSGFDVSAYINISKYDGCTDKPTKKLRCKCIHEHISGKRTSSVKTKNDSTGSGEKSIAKTNLDQRIEEAELEAAKVTSKIKEPYFKQHAEVYKLMTIQAAAQKKILGINEMDPTVGCSASKMSEGIKAKTEKDSEALIVKLNEKKTEYKEKADKCDNKWRMNVRFGMNLRGCDYYRNKSAFVEKKIENLKNIKDQKEKENCLMAMRTFDNPAMQVDMKVLMEYKEKLDESGRSHKDVVGSSEQIVNGVLTSLGIERSMITSSTLAMQQIAQGNYGSVDEMIKQGRLSCTDFFEKVDELQNKMDRKEENGPNGGASIVNIPENLSLKNQCPDNDPICLSFALKNRTLYKNAANVYKPEEKSCLSYAEFLTIKGMPSDELLKDFAKSKNPAELLSATGKSSWLSGGTSKAQIKFLQSNPLIVQLAQNKGGKQELGQLLKEMSKDMLALKGNKSAGMKRYLDFMKSSQFNKMYKDAGSDTSLQVCDQLQRGFSAISLSDEFVDRAEGKGKDPAAHQVYACVKALHEDLNVSDLDESLAVSEIYNLSKDEPKIPSYEDYEKEREEYCNSANLKETQEVQNAMNSRGVKRGMNRSDMAAFATPYDRAQHDEKYMAKYHEEVTSKMDQSSLAMKGESKAFEDKMNRNAEISSSSHVADDYRKSRDTSNPSYNSNVAGKQFGSVPDGFEASKDNSDQVRPQFESPIPAPTPAAVANFESMSPQSIQEAKSISDLDPSFNERPYEEKLSTYKALKDYVSESGVQPSFSPSEEIKSLEKSLEESKTAIKDLEKVEDEKENKVAQSKASVASRAPANFQQASFVAPISSAPVLGQFPGSRAVIGSEAKLSKAEASYQAALMQKYEMSQDLQILVQGQDAVVKAL